MFDTYPKAKRMPFGQYRGLHLFEVPSSYMLWLAKQPNICSQYPEIGDYIYTNMRLLKLESKRRYLEQPEDEDWGDRDW